MTRSQGTEPESIAAELIYELELNIHRPVNLTTVARTLNIRVVRKKIKDGILGACKAEGSHRLVVLSPDIGHTGRERFTFAHEIGHILMHHGIHCCRKEDFYWHRTMNHEQMANRFAASLLMPQKAIEPVLRKKSVTLGLAEDLSETYGVSTLSMALRLVGMATDPTALLYFENGKYKWMLYPKGRWVETRPSLHIDDLTDHGEYGQRDASFYFSNMRENTPCWSQVKRYVLNSGYDFGLCLVTFDDFCDEESDYY
jgi:Zn-dependent peptidase ImmA (M78 family)